MSNLYVIHGQPMVNKKMCCKKPFLYYGLVPQKIYGEKIPGTWVISVKIKVYKTPFSYLGRDYSIIFHDLLRSYYKLMKKIRRNLFGPSKSHSSNKDATGCPLYG